MYNNLKAPRFNARAFRENIVSEELYNQWKEQTGRTESFSEFKEVWEKIADSMVEFVIEERDGIKLAKGMGDIYIGYVPGAQKKFIDYQSTKEYGKTIYHENWNTNGKAGKIIYGTRKRKYLYRLSNWWGFKGCRNFTRAASKALKEFPERYKNSIEKRTGK